MKSAFFHRLTIALILGWAVAPGVQTSDVAAAAFVAPGDEPGSASAEAGGDAEESCENGEPVGESERAAQKSPFITQARQLTFEGRRAGEGYFSPDGDLMVFQSEREEGNPFYQIYLLDLTTGDVTRVSPGVGKTTCGFIRPGHEQVLFASTHLDPASEELQRAELEAREEGRERRYEWDYDSHFDLFSADDDGSDLRRLTDAEGYDAEASYSPDGEQIVFTSMRSAYPLEELSEEDRKRAEFDLSWFGDIYIMNADGSDVRRLTETPGYDGGPFFSPDGERIVWRRFNEEGTLADVYTMKTDGTDVRRVTDFGAMSWAPYYHPSGEYIVFASNKLGFANFELYIVDAAGEKEPVRASYSDGFDGLPVFHPDGDRLSWTSTRYAPAGTRAGGQIYLGAWDDEAAREALEQAAARTNHSELAAAEKAEDEGAAEEKASGVHGDDEEAGAHAHGEGEPASQPTTQPAAQPATQPARDEETEAEGGEAAETENNIGGDVEETVTTTAQRPEEFPPTYPELMPELPPHDFEPAIAEDDIKRHVAVLASEEFEGRLTGTPGERAAAEYLAAEFHRIGLEPILPSGGYLQEFPFTAGVSLGEGNVLAAAPAVANPHIELEKRIPEAPEDFEELPEDSPWTALEPGEDFLPLASSAEGTTTGLVAFAGYGLIVPGENGEPVYDSYADLDVEGKIVIVLRYVPEEVDKETRALYLRQAALRVKAMHARERGAAGILIVAGPNSPNAGEPIDLGLDFGGGSSGMLSGSITIEAADRLLASSGQTIEELQAALDEGEPAPGFTVEDTAAHLRVDLVTQTRMGHNVVGWLPPSVGEETVPAGVKELAGEGMAAGAMASAVEGEGADGADGKGGSRGAGSAASVAPSDAARNPAGSAAGIVAIGAHMDHVGRGGGGSSLARKGEEMRIHYGADDNASGTAALLEIAESMVAAHRASAAGTRGTVDPEGAALPAPLPRGVLFGAWSGEELGLLGANHFVENPPVELERIEAYLNMDMVGRLEENKLSVQGVGSAEEWTRLMERLNVPAGFNLTLTKDPYLPTDSMAFYLKGIPTLQFFSGVHEDYHRPTDTPEKLNYEGIERIAKLVRSVATEVATGEVAPAYVEVARSARRAGPGGEGLRAYLGTIPDYAGEVEGVRLAGVQSGGPADEAGLREGDVIVNLAGQEVANVYDYTYAIDTLKVDEATSVTVVRAGERVELEIVPRKRE